MSDRERMARLAGAVIGLGANPAKGRDEFLALVGPGETPAVAADLATLSTCGLTVRGLWGRFGMRDARLSAPYAPGAVITTIRDMATEAGGWTADVAALGLGDVILVSEPDHVGTIYKIAPRDGGGWNVTTVDGGSKDGAGYQAVVTYDRAIGPDGSILSGPLSGNGRKLLGIAQLPALAAAFGGGGGGAGEAGGEGAAPKGGGERGAGEAGGEGAAPVSREVLAALTLLCGLAVAWRLTRGRWGL